MKTRPAPPDGGGQRRVQVDRVPGDLRAKMASRPASDFSDCWASSTTTTTGLRPCGRVPTIHPRASRRRERRASPDRSSTTNPGGLRDAGAPDAVENALALLVQGFRTASLIRAPGSRPSGTRGRRRPGSPRAQPAPAADRARGRYSSRCGAVRQEHADLAGENGSSPRAHCATREAHLGPREHEGRCSSHDADYRCLRNAQ